MMVGMLSVMPISIGAAETITIASVDDWMDKLSGKEVGEANITVTAAELDFTGKELKPAKKFKGSFNGNGVVIKNANINNAGDECGLFYCLDGAATFENFSIQSSEFYGKQWAGSIACCTKGDFTVKNVYIHSDVTVKTDEGYTGGLLGGCTSGSSITLTFTDCAVAATVTSDGRYVGGFVGDGNTAGETKAKTINLNNCLMLGSAMSTVGDASGFVGYNVKSDTYGVINATNCIYAGKGFVSYPLGNAGRFTATNCYTTHVNADKRLYKNAGVAITTDDANTGVTVIDANSLLGTDSAVTIEGFTKRANDIMVPTGVAEFAPQYISDVTIKWEVNGEIVATETYKMGETPTYKGETPTKAEDDTYTYTFYGWSPAVTVANADVTYKAEFYKTRKAVSVDTEAETNAPETNAPVTNAPETDAPAAKSGCGSIIGGGAFALVAVMGCAIAFGSKRRED